MAEIELKPCPFCGEDAVHLDKAYSYYSNMVIYCENCDTVFLLDDCHSTEKELVEAWNRRVDTTKVVHCKDCKHYQNHPNGLCYLHTEPCDNKYKYKGDAVCVEPNDFCSYGERRVDNDT